MLNSSTGRTGTSSAGLLERLARQVEQACLGIDPGEVPIQECVARGADGHQAGPLGLAGGRVDRLDMAVEHDRLDQVGEELW
jgi:hypothetical protein